MNSQSKPTSAKISAVAGVGNVTMVPNNLSPLANRDLKLCAIIVLAFAIILAIVGRDQQMASDET
jgi:hypothetical protein